MNFLLLLAVVIAVAAGPQSEGPAWTKLIPEPTIEAVQVPSEELTAGWIDCQEVSVGTNRTVVEMQVSLVVDLALSPRGAVERFRLFSPRGKVSELFAQPLADAVARWRFEPSHGASASRVSRIVLAKPRGAYRTAACTGARPNNLQRTSGEPPAAE